jgi:23S rRNA (guanosine2251-2'-O)-methyltransferase
MKKLQNEDLDRPGIDEFKQLKKLSLVIVLDNIRSMHNIGSVFRTSDAFLVESIYLCGITATPPHKDIQKTALGSTESVHWKYFKDTISAVKILKSEGYSIIGIEQTNKSIQLQNFIQDKNEKYALVFGHEVRGVEQEVIDLCDFAIEVPQFGTKHSLNISVCTGIVMWEFFRKIKFQ